MTELKPSLSQHTITVGVDMPVWTHEDAVLQRLDKIIALLAILTSAVPDDDDEEESQCYLDGTLME